MALDERGKDNHRVDKRLWDKLEERTGMLATSKLNEYCQALHLGEVVYVSAVEGLPHYPVFSFYAQLAQFHATGQGPNKQDAKRRAAQSLWEKLSAS